MPERLRRMTACSLAGSRALSDVITFEGVTFAEARQAFRDSIDDYLAFCAEQTA
jgi:predicted HicB family RNase H-like nuclease